MDASGISGSLIDNLSVTWLSPAASTQPLGVTSNLVNGWEPYDPTWLVDLARQQEPDEPWLPEALAKCCRAWRQSPAYTYFVNPKNPNQPGSEWQFETNIVLEHPTEGTLVLDILKNQRVGGIETIDRIEQ